jgi:AraC-like DNA-binding protein
MLWNRVVEFTDPEVFHAARQSVAQGQILPTTKGSYHVEATQIGMGALRLQRLKIALPQITTHTVVPDRESISFLIEESSSETQVCGHLLTPADISVSGRDVEHVRSEADFRIGTMSLPTDQMSGLYRTIVGRDFEARKRSSVVCPHLDLTSRLKKLHKLVGQLAQAAAETLELPEVARALEMQLAHVMVRCLADGTALAIARGGLGQHATMSRFEQYLEANPDRPLHLTEICAGIGVAERTLRAACEEYLGMGPIRYLTLRRMHLARRALLHCDPARSNVTMIATDYGFWELGRFSVAYRNLFGESPSETLRQARRERAIHLNRPSSFRVD